MAARVASGIAAACGGSAAAAAEYAASQIAARYRAPTPMTRAVFVPNAVHSPSTTRAEDPPARRIYSLHRSAGGRIAATWLIMVTIANAAARPLVIGGMWPAKAAASGPMRDSS